jgi:hypothetical protein
LTVAPWETTKSAGRPTIAPKGRIGADIAKASVTNDRRTQAANAHHLSQEPKKGTKMKNILLTSLAAGALASAALGLAGTATAAPSGSSPVDDTISQLQAEGFNVIVSRVKSAAVDQCTLNAVRPGQTFSRTDSGVPGAQDDPVTTVTNKTVYVDVIC